jgi:uncharacterized protein YhaN
MAHDCNRSQEIAEIKESVKEIEDKMWKENGIVSKISLLTQTVKEHTIATADLKTAMNGMHDFMANYEGKKQAEAELKANLAKKDNTMRWLIGISVGTIVSLIGVIIAIIT